MDKKLITDLEKHQGVGGMSRKAEIHRPFRAGVLNSRPTFCDLLRNLEG